MPLQATSGAASYDAFGGGVVAEPNYIESVFSTYLYTGNGSTQTITNNIDLSGKGGLTWIKVRNDTWENILTDTVRGATIEVVSNATYANITNTDDLTAFTSSGFSVGNGNAVNQSNRNYVSWTFRKQPKFFDIVTWTGNGANRTIAHNLGSVPGCIIVKRTDASANWSVYHRSLANTQYLTLNTNDDASTDTTTWNSTTATSTVFSLGTDTRVNASGGTYIAYLFAHNAGGFGLTGTDNVVSCGTFTTDGSGLATVNLGYEPQWVMVKSTSAFGNWFMFDIMRGYTADTTSGTDARLYANTSGAEVNTTAYGGPNATGFTGYIAASTTYIYIAIRRGPMKVPTSGTSVFSPIAYTGNSTTNTTVQNLTTSFAGDTVIIQQRTGGNNPLVFDKLRGSILGLYTSLTLAEEDINAFRAGQSVGFNNTQTVLTGQFTAQGNYNYSGDTLVGWNFGRAPSFFDEVCYTGNGAGANNQTHNLGVVPEMCILRRRSSAANWQVVHKNDGVTAASLALNLTNATIATSVMSDNFTSTYFKTADSTCWFEASNGNTSTFVAYLFATCAGVSKVGSYTGTATTKQVDCGFTGGARFVLIKKTSGTGSWYVWDSSRGIVSGNDPYLLLNSTAAEVTNTDYIDTYSAGFEISSTAPSEINENGGSFIFLAIA